MNITRKWLISRMPSNRLLYWFEDKALTDRDEILNSLSRADMLQDVIWMICHSLIGKNAVELAIFAAELVLPIFERMSPFATDISARERIVAAYDCLSVGLGTMETDVSMEVANATFTAICMASVAYDLDTNPISIAEHHRRGGACAAHSAACAAHSAAAFFADDFGFTAASGTPSGDISHAFSAVVFGFSSDTTHNSLVGNNWTKSVIGHGRSLLSLQTI